MFERSTLAHCLARSYPSRSSFFSFTVVHEALRCRGTVNYLPISLDARKGYHLLLVY